MRVSELINHLETIQDDYGDLHVSATCDGWAPPEVSVDVHPDRDSVTLYGCRDVSFHSSFENGDSTVTVNAPDD